MKLTLTFEGEVRTGNKSPKAAPKHERRRVFHAQLKRLWRVNSLLATWHLPISDREAAPAIDVIENNYPRLGGFGFVPLISRELSVEAAVHFHILRPTEFKGNNADPDNIVKVLMDSLKMPQTADELPNGAIPQQDETPLFVLMQDDGLVSKISSVSDELLQPILGKSDIDRSDTRVLIEVYIRPNFPNNANLIFFSDDSEVWNHQWSSALDGIRNWSNSELKARATQCVLRMRVTASNFQMQRNARFINRPFPPMPKSEEERNREWHQQTASIMEQNEEQNGLWNSRLRPVALAFKDELQRRVYGEPPYPADRRLLALDDGLLAGVNPIGNAALALESLIRQLP